MKARIWITLIVLIFSIPAFAWGDQITCNLSTSELEVALDPTNTSLYISGVAPENAPVIVKVEGSMVPEQVSMNQNHSWFFNYAETEVLGLPGYYQILTSDSSEKIEKSQYRTLGLNPNYEELTAHAWVRVRQVNPDDPVLHLEEDYIKLAIQQKIAKNFYGIRQGVVKRQGNRYYANIPLMANMPLGELKVTALAPTGNTIDQTKPQIVTIKSSSFLSTGIQELAANPVLIIALFMIPTLLMTAGQILEALEDRKRLRQLRNIWR